MIPSQKSTELERALTAIFGIDRAGSITENVCVACRKPIGEFRDELSQREFTISGLCQSCQDQIFSKN
jgi:hypothetical protein